MRYLRGDRLLMGILALALILRFVCLYQMGQSPLLGGFAADTTAYDKLATEILEGNLTSSDSVYPGPIYPFFLALVYGVLGHSPTAVAVVQILLDALVCLFLYLICVRLFDCRGTALLSSFIYACYGIAIFYAGFTLDTTLAVFLTVTLMLVLLWAASRETWWAWLLCGLTLGLTMLLKANVILFLPFLVLWVAHFRDGETRKKLSDAGLVLAGLVIFLIPFAVRNYSIQGRLSPFPVLGGVNFYVGNNPDANGFYVSLPGVPDTPIEQVKASISKAEEETGKEMSAAQASRYWFARGRQFIWRNKMKAMSLAARKVLLFWNAAEMDANLNYYFSKRFLPVLKWPLFSFGLIAPLVLLGFVLSVRERLSQTYIVITYIATHMVSLVMYFVGARYRLPCVPLMMIFGAYAVHRLAALMRPGNRKGLAVSFGLLAAFFVVVNLRVPPTHMKNDFTVAHNNLGLAYYDRGMMKESIVEYRKAIETNPSYASAYFNLGSSYYAMGMLDEALVEYRKTIELTPDAADAHFNLGLCLDRKGQRKAAISSYERAIALGLDDIDVHINLAYLYSLEGLLDKAIPRYRNVIEMDPDRAGVRFNLGVTYYKKGMFEKAAAEYRAAIRIRPDYLEARVGLADAYFQMGMFEKGIQELETVLQMAPDREDVRRVLEKAREAHRQGDTTEVMSP